ncbi:MAG: outer membrane beta-barrel protein [Steroidobacteraceae bacterium]
MSNKVGAAAALALVAIAPHLLLAADAGGQKPAAASWADTLAAWGVTANGYVATSYAYSNGYPFNIHQFDPNHDTFQLDEAGFSIAYQPKQGFGALADVIAGEDAKILNAAENGSGVFDIRQAYLQYATGPLTVQAGKLLTLAGAEVINPTQNTNFSRSLLFFDNEPLTHTGVRATYAVTGTFNFIAGVNNGWNVMSTSYGSKTGEVGVGWTPNKTFSVTTQAYFGKMLPYDAQRTLVDVVATYNATSSLTLILNVDWDQQAQAFGVGVPGTATWYGTAAYANYAFSSQWRVSGRLEYLDDKDGFATGAVDGQHLWEGTVTFGYAPTSNFELRLEGRYDSAQLYTFYRTTAAIAALTPDGNSLSELAIQGVLKF